MSMIIAPGVHPTWLVLLKGVIQPQWTSGFEASTFASLACAPPAAAPEKCEGWPGAAAPGQPSHFSLWGGEVWRRKEEEVKQVRGVHRKTMGPRL